MRNHYVPEFFFEPWLDERRHLYQFASRQSELVADKKTPGQICYGHDLHTFTGAVADETKHYVEKWLTSEVDDRAAPVIKKILISGMQTLDAVDASHFVRFIQALIVRRPESIRTLREQTAPLLLENLSALEQNQWPDIASTLSDAGLSVKEWVEKQHPGLIENAGQLMIGQLIANSNAGEKLFRLEWIGADLSGTSIYPLVVSDKGLVARGNGLDDPNSILILPIAPTYCCFGAAPKMMGNLRALGRGQLGLFAMRNIISDARRYVYGMQGSNLTLISRYLPKLST